MSDEKAVVVPVSITLTVEAVFIDEPDAHTERWVMDKLDAIVYDAITKKFPNTLELQAMSTSIDSGRSGLFRNKKD